MECGHQSYAAARARYPAIDAVLFLGDLLNEGSEAGEVEYGEYAARFHTIYPAMGSSMIYLPGDNDIGGEGVDPVTQDKLDRWVKGFQTILDNSISRQVR